MRTRAHPAPFLSTNITEPIRKYATSRGELVSHFLLPKTPKQQSLQAEIDAFLGAHRERDIDAVVDDDRHIVLFAELLRLARHLQDLRVR